VTGVKVKHLKTSAGDIRLRRGVCCHRTCAEYRPFYGSSTDENLKTSFERVAPPRIAGCIRGGIGQTMCIAERCGRRHGLCRGHRGGAITRGRKLLTIASHAELVADAVDGEQMLWFVAVVAQFFS
jgi:hypothetical protein